MEQTFDVNIRDHPGKVEPRHYPFVHNIEGINVKTLPKFSKVGMKLIKTVTGKILKGYAVSEITLPSMALANSSHAQGQLKELALVSEYINYAVNSTKDPVERAKLIFGGTVGSLTFTPTYFQGMMPIPVPVGSTSQAETPSGVKLYYEKFGPKKNDAYIYGIGPDDSFKLSLATCQTIKMRGIKPSKLKVVREKPLKIDIGGTKYTVTYPLGEIDDALRSTKLIRFVKNFSVKDETNNIEVIGTIVPPKGKGGWFKKATDTNVEELNKFEIEVRQEGKKIGGGVGSWSAYVQIDGKLYWSAEDVQPDVKYEGEARQLPSDVSDWDVVQLIIDEKFEEADQILKKLEKADDDAAKARKKKKR